MAKTSRFAYHSACRGRRGAFAAPPCAVYSVCSSKETTRWRSSVIPHRPRRRAAVIVAAVALLALLLPATALADAVIGTGTAASCETQQAANDLSTAVAAGGTITFNCGPAMVTIVANTNATDKTVVVNGGGKVTLSGDNLRQIFFVFGTGNVTLNDLILIDGDAGQGGAIYVDTQARVTLNRSFVTSNKASNARAPASTTRARWPSPPRRWAATSPRATAGASTTAAAP